MKGIICMYVVGADRHTQEFRNIGLTITICMHRKDIDEVEIEPRPGID